MRFHKALLRLPAARPSQRANGQQPYGFPCLKNLSAKG